MAKRSDIKLVAIKRGSHHARDRKSIEDFFGGKMLAESYRSNGPQRHDLIAGSRPAVLCSLLKGGYDTNLLRALLNVCNFPDLDKPALPQASFSFRDTLMNEVLKREADDQRLSWLNLKSECLLKNLLSASHAQALNESGHAVLVEFAKAINHQYFEDKTMALGSNLALILSDENTHRVDEAFLKDYLGNLAANPVANGVQLGFLEGRASSFDIDLGGDVSERRRQLTAAQIEQDALEAMAESSSSDPMAPELTPEMPLIRRPRI